MKDIVSLQPSITYNLIVASFSFSIFILIQGFFLFKYSQTIGKLATNIKIVGADNKPISFIKLVTLRYAVLYLISAVPAIGGIVILLGYLMIFAEDRKCLHDHIAGTKVFSFQSETGNGRAASA